MKERTLFCPNTKHQKNPQFFFWNSLMTSHHKQNFKLALILFAHPHYRCQPMSQSNASSQDPSNTHTKPKKWTTQKKKGSRTLKNYWDERTRQSNNLLRKLNFNIMENLIFMRWGDWSPIQKYALSNNWDIVGYSCQKIFTIRPKHYFYSALKRKRQSLLKKRPRCFYWIS